MELRLMFADEVRLTKGTCLLVGALVIITNFLFLFAAIILTDERQPELNGIQIRETREDVKHLSDKVDGIQEMLANQAIKDAEIKGRDFGYRMGKVDQEKGH